MSFLKAPYDISCSGIKPNDRIVKRLTGSLIPGNCCFALICNTDSLDIGSSVCVDKITLIARNDLVVALLHGVVDLHRVVLAPARMQRDLVVRARRTVKDLQVLVDKEHARRRGSLIDRHYVLPWGSRGELSARQTCAKLCRSCLVGRRTAH